MRRSAFWSAMLLGMTILAGCVAPAAAPGAAPAAQPTAAATTASSGSEASASCTTPDPVTLQLKWVAQAQFAGYYAAAAENFYKDECLDVTINPGGPDIVPEQVVAGGQAQFGIDFLPSLLS